MLLYKFSCRRAQPVEKRPAEKNARTIQGQLRDTRQLEVMGEEQEPSCGIACGLLGKSSTTEDERVVRGINWRRKRMMRGQPGGSGWHTGGEEEQPHKATFPREKWIFPREKWIFSTEFSGEKSGFFRGKNGFDAGRDKRSKKNRRRKRGDDEKTRVEKRVRED